MRIQLDKIIGGAKFAERRSSRRASAAVGWGEPQVARSEGRDGILSVGRAREKSIGCWPWPQGQQCSTFNNEQHPAMRADDPSNAASANAVPVANAVLPASSCRVLAYPGHQATGTKLAFPHTLYARRPRLSAALSAAPSGAVSRPLRPPSRPSFHSPFALQPTVTNRRQLQN